MVSGKYSYYSLQYNSSLKLCFFLLIIYIFLYYQELCYFIVLF